MSDDIEFGEVEQAGPCCALRPDENRHFAVARFGQPGAGDLPIFVDLDVLVEMESHAHCNTSVELGGVLLGTCHHDTNGRPFVLVTDCLRAQHYESTRGSFKFTHDTWAAITRERERFPAELQMVGWYHTHPGWGVFLSGLDLFICEHFFNKPLDIAYVIDPCRGDRGMFQWTADQPPADQQQPAIPQPPADPQPHVRPTGGFFVTTSRFRAAELEYQLAELCRTMPATPPIRAPGGQPAGPEIHLHQSTSPGPTWQAVAVAGALGLQLLLVAVIAWKTLTPSPAAEQGNETNVVKTLNRLNESLAALEARRQADLAQERGQARAAFLDEAFRELKGTEEGAIARLQARFDQSTKLTEDVSARDAEIRELRRMVAETRSQLQSVAEAAQRDEKRHTARIDELIARNQRLETDLKTTSAEAAALAAKLSPAKAAAAAAGSGSPVSRWWWIGGGALAAMVLVGGVWWGGTRGWLLSAAATRQQEPADVSLARPADFK